jgi:hypothetical protein
MHKKGKRPASPARPKPSRVGKPSRFPCDLVTLDNGGKPFAVHSFVELNSDDFLVDVVDNDFDSPSFRKVIYEFTASRMIENNESMTSVVLQLAGQQNKYIFIGDTIFGFELEANERIVHLQGEIGPSATPYPVLIGTTNAYFLLDDDKVSVPREILDNMFLQWEALRQKDPSRPVINRYNYEFLFALRNPEMFFDVSMTDNVRSAKRHFTITDKMRSAIKPFKFWVIKSRL